MHVTSRICRFPVHTEVYLEKTLCKTHSKVTLDGYLQRHSFKRRTNDRASVFDELGVRMCS